MNPNAVIELHNVAIFHQEDELREANFGRHGRMGDMVLSDVNLEVYPGEMVYLIGRVGSGKSSLLKTLYAELPLKEGMGRVVGFDLRRIRRKDVPYLRRRIGIVFQDYQLLTDRSVFHNLRFVLRATGAKSLRCWIWSICKTRSIRCRTNSPVENSSVWRLHVPC